MGLFLVETDLRGQGAELVQGVIERLARSIAQSGGELIEAHVGRDVRRLFVIVEQSSQEAVERALASSGLDAASPKPVRLVGQDLEAVKAGRRHAGYLVEWAFPEGLTMDAYLKRKKEKSVNYASVPEVQFRRTYVCEDMSKCLCLYDAPDDAAVLRARQAVDAPVSGLTALERVGPPREAIR
jgi:hypothetical protein